MVKGMIVTVMNLYNIRCTSQPTHSILGRSASSFLSEGVERRLFCYTEVSISSIASCNFALLLFIMFVLSPAPIMLELMKPLLFGMSILYVKSYLSPVAVNL